MFFINYAQVAGGNIFIWQIYDTYRIKCRLKDSTDLIL